jgi:hypothetical protein
MGCGLRPLILPGISPLKVVTVTYSTPLDNIQGGLLDERKRISAWLPESDLPWLKKLQIRIEKQTDGKHLCEINVDDVISRTSKKLTKKYALFYKKGYFNGRDGNYDWIPD